MKKKILKILTVGSLATVLSYGVYAYGCAGDWWGSGYSSIFSPEITVNNKNYEPFFYDDYTTFYNGYSIESTTALFKEETVNDWTTYLKKYKPEVIEYYLFDKELSPTLAKVGKAKNVEAEFKKQKFKHTLDLNDEKSQRFVLFLMLARGIETYSNQTYDYWDYENRKKLNADNSFTSKVENLYNKEVSQNDAFFKNRIWFQVLRSKFYSNDKEAVVKFFNETSTAQPKNTLYYRGLSYVAGAYKSMGNYQKSNELFAQVFNESKPLMAASLFDYKPLENSAFESVVKATTNQATKEALYALQGYYTNSFDALQALYKMNASSPHIDFLLSRWVNINEQSINTYTGYETLDIDAKKVKKELKGKVDENQLKWINEVATNAKVHNPYIWKATAGYFNALVGEYKKAHVFLNDAQRLATNNGQKEQVRSLTLLNNLLSIDKINKAAEEKLVADVTWVLSNDTYPDYSETSAAQSKFDRYMYLQNFVKKYISALYQKEGDKVMSELSYPVKGFYKDQKQSIAMEKLLLTNNRSSWQQAFVNVYPYKLADIYESRGIYLYYQDKIDEAIVEFEKITPFETKEYNWEKEAYETKMIDYKEVQFPGNPFNGKIKDCNDCDYIAKQSVKYGQLEFLKKIKEMKAKIAAGEDVYNNALLLGNAFYNTSYFGNGRFFYSNSIIGEYGNSIGNEHAKMLYGMENVSKYYKIAQNVAADNEQKAKMAYMLAKVERNNFYTTNYFTRAEGYWGYHDGADFKAWQGFVDLKNQYSDTKYYQEVIAECGYFRTYIGLQ